MKTIKIATVLAAALTVALDLAACADQPVKQATSSAEALKAGETVRVFTRNVAQPYTIIKKVRAEVYVIDAKSEADAELQAFRQLRAKAAELGGDGIIEVRRYIYEDGMAQRPGALPRSAGGMLVDDLDATATPLDELTLDNYDRNIGSLSTKRIAPTFDRAGLSQKSVVFTGKVIKLTK